MLLRRLVSTLYWGFVVFVFLAIIERMLHKLLIPDPEELRKRTTRELDKIVGALNKKLRHIPLEFDQPFIYSDSKYFRLTVLPRGVPEHNEVEIWITLDLLKPKHQGLHEGILFTLQLDTASSANTYQFDERGWCIRRVKRGRSYDFNFMVRTDAQEVRRAA